MIEARKSASRGQNELKWVFFGTSRSDITVIYDPWPYISPSTPSGEVSCPLWTKSEVLNPSRGWLRSEKVPKVTILARFWPKIKSIYLWATKNRACSRHVATLRLSHGPDGPIGHLRSLSEVQKVKKGASGVSRSKNRSDLLTTPLKTPSKTAFESP